LLSMTITLWSAPMSVAKWQASPQASVYGRLSIRPAQRREVGNRAPRANQPVWVVRLTPAKGEEKSRRIVRPVSRSDGSFGRVGVGSHTRDVSPRYWKVTRDRKAGERHRFSVRGTRP